MRLIRRSECRLYRRALLALELPEVADAAGTLFVDAATLGHLETCERCRVTVEGHRLASHRLLRDLAPARRIGPGPEAWPTLRSRVARRAPATPRAARASLAGLLSAGLAAALLIAVARPAPPIRVDEPGFDPRPLLEQGRRDAADEARWLHANRLVRAPAPAAVPQLGRPPAVGSSVSILARYGEGGSAARGPERVLAPSVGYRVE